MSRLKYVFLKEDQKKIEEIRAKFEKLRKGGYNCNEPALEFNAAFGKMPIEKFVAAFRTYQNYVLVFQTQCYQSLHRDEVGVRNEVNDKFVGIEEEIISKFIRILDDRDPETLLEYMSKDIENKNFSFETMRERYPNLDRISYDNLYHFETLCDNAKVQIQNGIFYAAANLEKVVKKDLVEDLQGNM